ncbi:MAG: ABC transporter substrate-binding protein [Clostridia bacterium]|nr:ABC transporter substrate-binding protein [Clostridia bacterium]
MKKFLALILGCLIVFSGVSCTDKTEEKTYKLGVVDGAPTLAVANVLSEGFTFRSGSEKYVVEVDLVGSAQNISAGLISGEYDMAIAPLNLASTIYNNKSELGIRLASVNIFGCLYAIGGEVAEDMSAYKGKTVISVGAGGTPDVIFRNLLITNGIGVNGEDENDPEKVTITYAQNAAGVIAAFNKNEADYAVLGEPAVTTVCNKLGKVVAMDIQSEWKKTYENSNFVQAGLFLAGEAAENSDFIEAFINKLSGNAKFLEENIDKLNEIFLKAESSLKDTAFTPELISRCNVGCKKAKEVKPDVETFLSALYGFNPAQIGGKLPGDDFYL